MKTLICNNPGNIEYIERDIPHLKDDEVLLKIKAVGICGTDIHAFAGRQPFFAYPRVLGHEICGVAEILGKSCSTAKVGQRYSVIPCIPCGACAACREGKTNCCENVSLYGVHQDGGFSEYLAVREQNLVELSDNLTDSAGALVECFAISAHAVRRAVDLIRHGGKIVFIGLYIGELVIDDPTFHKKETTLLSSRNATREDFECVIELMAQGAISETMMKNQEFDFYTFGNQYQKNVVENKKLVKGVIKF
ncbi:alcohol dehydrogenase catalytic domain-containing protein [Salmonella enterica]|nr:alcohol dehydrogenase catalytic domain-containing protein [Salmonella enterica]